MAKFVRMLQFFSKHGEYDLEKDNAKVNEVLSELQEKGARIVEVKGELGPGAVSGGGSASHHMVYIVYEAPSPIEVEVNSGGVF